MKVDIKTTLGKITLTRETLNSYDLSGVRLLTSEDGTAYLVNTDGVACAVVPTHIEGTIPEGNSFHTIPNKIVPSKHVEREVERDENGIWSRGDVTACESPSGSFPNICNALPDISKGHTVIKLDANALFNLALALSNHKEKDIYITMFVPNSPDGVIDSPIGVIGNEGIGAIAPHVVYEDTKNEIKESYSAHRNYIIDWWDANAADDSDSDSSERDELAKWLNE